MAENIAARRHAQAIFQIAQENEEFEKWRSDLNSIASVLTQPELLPILGDPKVRYDDKISLVKRCLPEINGLAFNLVCLLIKRGRGKIAGLIANEYSYLVDSYQGLEHAEVTTAVPIDEEEKFAERLSTGLGKKIKLSTKVDPNIIGGFVIRIRDQLIDGSVRAKLENLRHSLRQGT